MKKFVMALFIVCIFFVTGYVKSMDIGPGSQNGKWKVNSPCYYNCYGFVIKVENARVDCISGWSTCTKVECRDDQNNCL